MVENAHGTLGVLLILIAIACLAAGLIGRHLRRRQFLRDLLAARITPAELKQKLDSHEPIIVLDLRHSLDFLAEPYTIPGAMRVPLESLGKRPIEVPKDRDVALYCTCPNETSSATAAVKLRRYGIIRVRPLQGGFHSWLQSGFPVQSLTGPSQAAPASQTERHELIRAVNEKATINPDPTETDILFFDAIDPKPPRV